ncbi:MAG: universal stress protein [Deltaproteobacteria bacterium]|nr:universal stress protein [Deltaproteobacteria bacterium]
MTNREKTFNKNILIAVDESENARRAVSYVGQLLGGLEGFSVLLLHVFPEPDEDFFRTQAEKEQWMEKRRQKMESVLADYRGMLIDSGFGEDQVRTRSTMRYCPSMAECILEERGETEYSTIVVGRQGLSRSEEFLFGSISSKIVNHARNCTVWVVE